MGGRLLAILDEHKTLKSFSDLSVEDKDEAEALVCMWHCPLITYNCNSSSQEMEYSLRRAIRHLRPFIVRIS